MARDRRAAHHKINDRVGAAPFDAMLGLRVTRPSYVKLNDLDQRTTTRDLVRAADLCPLEARDERRGRHYVAGAALTAIRERLRAQRKPLDESLPNPLG